MDPLTGRRFASLLALHLLLPALAQAAVCRPVERWSWDGPREDPTYPEPSSSPLVTQLSDDNGDGRIDASDRPDVVFIHHRGYPYSGLITALDGATGFEHWTERTHLVLPTPLATGDIDGDGEVEVVAVSDDHLHVVAFEADGSPKWTSDPAPRPIYEFSAVNIADLDQDGSPEIYSGATVFSAAGRLLWSGSAGRGVEGYWSLIEITTAVDLDPVSPGLELLAGNTLYSATGAVLWQAPVADGWTAVADLDGDGQPEIVHTTTDQVRLLDARGNLRGSPHTVWGSLLAQPAVGDLDGDGDREVVVTQWLETQALEWNGTGFSQLWSAPTYDDTGVAGPSLFDLDGDGADEVIYNGGLELFVIEGRSGTVLHRLPMGSATLIEAPVVADLDGDCQTEVLITTPHRAASPSPAATR